MGTIKWTLEACKADAAKYKTRNEWRKNSNAYEKARREKWLDECPVPWTGGRHPTSFIETINFDFNDYVRPDV